MDLDPEDYDYGKLLYSETDSHEAHSKAVSRRFIIFIFCSGLILLLMSLIILIWSYSIQFWILFIVMLAVVIMMFRLGIMVMRSLKRRVKFSIYEKGIKFPNPETPLLKFSDIDYIHLGIDKKHHVNYFEIMKKGDKYYFANIANGKRKWALEFPDEYDDIYQIIVSRLKKIKKVASENRFIKKD